MRRTLLLLAKATTSILLLYFSLRWVNVSVLADQLQSVPAGMDRPRAFASCGPDWAACVSLAESCRCLRR